MLVSSIPSLQEAISNAQPGDTIVLANDTYITDTTILVSCHGVTIEAQTLGNVWFQGGSISFVIRGNQNKIRGFQFLFGDTLPTRPADLFSIRGNHNIIEHMNIQGFFVQHTINIYPQTQYNCIRSCNFQEKPIDAIINGSQIEIQADATMMGYHTISSCTFQKMLGPQGDFGNECIRLGEGSMSTFSLGAIVEYCVFDHTENCDSEIISVKSMHNIIRYNTIRNNPNAMICFRNCSQCVAYGNFIFGSGGFRIKQASDIHLYNNYLESSPCPILFDTIKVEDNIHTYQHHILVQHNTFIHCGNLVLGSSLQSLGNIFVNNLFYDTMIMISNPLIKFLNNAYYLTTSNLPTPPELMDQIMDPMLHINPYGYQSMMIHSPMLGKAISPQVCTFVIPGMDYDTNIGKDICGKIRPIPASIGCNEMFLKPITPQTISEIGPNFSYESTVQ
jgi:Chondroitinase B